MKYDIIITIFGSTGDLCARKLLPAIAKLYQTNWSNKKVKILALGRRKYDTSMYLEAMQLLSNKSINIKVLESIVEYYEIEITQSDHYNELNEYIKSISNHNTKQIFYLAIGPDILLPTAKQISQSGLIEKSNKNQVLVFEKPFGYDLISAKEINDVLCHFFDEIQIYRIDHYLGKEMIQNIMTLRFANRIFDDIWDKSAIKSIKISVLEKQGINNRALYYDKSGALRDMVQSHLLQLVCLIAMDIPKSYSSDDIKNEKIKVLESLSFDKKSLIFGQYKGYLNENNISRNSKTDTFVHFKLLVNNKRFENVPFYITTGKNMGIKKQCIEIEFLPTKEQEKWDLPLNSNKLILSLYPSEEVHLVLNSKEIGLKENIIPINLSFDMAKSVDGNVPEAYEKLILDIVNSHKTLFTRWDEIESSWKFIDKVSKSNDELIIYESIDDINKLLNNDEKINK